LMYLLAAYVKS